VILDVDAPVVGSPRLVKLSKGCRHIPVRDGSGQGRGRPRR
jgi:hypothetical protein